MFIESDPQVLLDQPDEALLLLERGLERLDAPHGWCKGDLFKTKYDTHNFCMLGAVQIEVTKSGYIERMRVGEAVGIALLCVARAIGFRPETIPAWNDDSDRRKHEVVAAFREAIRFRKEDLAREGDA